MRILLVAIVGAMLFAGVGCESMKKDSDKNESMSKKDDCSHCPGMQTANADGTCPMCGAKVK